MTAVAELSTLNASAIAALTRSGRLTAEAVARACLERIAERDEAVRAWAWLSPDDAIAAARKLDALDRRGPLHGVPIGIKDVFQTKDMPTEHNSPIYAGHWPGTDAACIGTLRTAGALILGKTGTVEFAGLGRRPPTRHPQDTGRSPGGTSSGSAAAVADFQVPLGLGTQTAGSTIRPASFCGVHAMKPTWGVVSSEGAKVFSPSLDTVAWLARSVADLALLADVFELQDAVPCPDEPRRLAGQRIGICRTPWWEEASEAVRVGLVEAGDALASAGAAVEETELPAEFAALRDVHLAIMMGEGRAAFLNEFRAHPDLLDSRYHAIFTGDLYVPPTRLRDAYDAATRARAAFDKLAASYDVILAPSATDEAPPFEAGTGSPAFNQIWTVLHAPCVNLPVRRGPNALPIGLTLTGPRFSDCRLLTCAPAIEAALIAAL